MSEHLFCPRHFTRQIMSLVTIIQNWRWEKKITVVGHKASVSTRTYIPDISVTTSPSTIFKVNTVQELCPILQRFDTILLGYAHGDHGRYNCLSLPASPCLNFGEFAVVGLVAGLTMTPLRWKQVRWENLTRPAFQTGSTWMGWGWRGPESNSDCPEYSFIQCKSVR